MDVGKVGRLSMEISVAPPKSEDAAVVLYCAGQGAKFGEYRHVFRELESSGYSLGSAKVLMQVRVREGNRCINLSSFIGCSSILLLLFLIWQFEVCPLRFVLSICWAGD